METKQQPTLEQILAKMAQSMDGKVPPAIQAASEVMPEMVFEQMRSKGFAMPQENGAISEETRTLIYLGVALATNNHACVEAMMNKSKTMGIEKAKLLETVKIARYAEATRIIGNAEKVFQHLKDEW